jgi:hypothetical protein
VTDPAPALGSRVPALQLRAFAAGTADLVPGSLREVWAFAGSRSHVAWPWQVDGAPLLLLLLVAGAITVAWLERAGERQEDGAAGSPQEVHCGLGSR